MVVAGYKCPRDSIQNLHLTNGIVFLQVGTFLTSFQEKTWNTWKSQVKITFLTGQFAWCLNKPLISNNDISGSLPALIIWRILIACCFNIATHHGCTFISVTLMPTSWTMSAVNHCNTNAFNTTLTTKNTNVSFRHKSYNFFILKTDFPFSKKLSVKNWLPW